MDRASLENQLFFWQDWDELDSSMSMQFYDVELKVAVGDFPIGTKFPSAYILGDNSLLVLTDNNDKQFSFALNISVGEAVEPEVYEGCGCGRRSARP